MQKAALTPTLPPVLRSECPPARRKKSTQKQRIRAPQPNLVPRNLREQGTLRATGPTAAVPAWLRASGIVLGGSALVAVCARLSLPLFFTPVPLSMAPFAVLLLGLALSPCLL